MKSTFLKEHLLEIFVALFSLIFSFWLMFYTFSYADGAIYIATKAWSDFESHIPLIRSFSFGNNFPPEYPLFPGESIRYHFLFYALVGMLERAGLRLDFALNIPSTLSFATLLIVVYLFAKELFKSKAVGILSVVFFLFNGSLSFLEFFKNHPLSIHTIKDIVENTIFPSFAPYGKGIVSAFWNLNIYTNQRHLAGAYALSLLLICFIVFPLTRKRKQTIITSLIIGAVLGMSFFFHMAVFMITCVVLVGIFLLFPKLRLSSAIGLIIAGVVGLPQYLTMQAGGAGFAPFIRPGYLVEGVLTPVSILRYWFFNLGLHILFIPLGFLFSPTQAKKLFLCVLPVFIIGNLIQFSPEIAANHKFFNYFMLIGTMFSAYTLVFLWKKKLTFRPLIVVLIFFLTLSGIIDFFPIANDVRGELADYPKNPDVHWIMENTPQNAVFLNASYFMHPVSLAGRRLFLGWPYFAWSQGYDTLKRDLLRKQLLSGSNRDTFCQRVKDYNLSYVIIEQTHQDEDFVINKAFFERYLDKLYDNKESRFVIYDAKKNC